jgi:histone deacetylase 1/2
MQNLQHQFETNAYLYLAENPFAADVDLPSSHANALAGPRSREWQEAIQAEIDSLQRLGVYKIVKQSSLPAGANIISGKWVFKVKPRPDGTIAKYKCRLCARGFLQKHGIDYNATFSPVATPASIKLLLAIAQRRGLYLRSADVSTAFLFGSLPESERVYMDPPPGIETNQDEVLELHKCVYGLKQASRRWYEKLRGVLEAAGYIATKADPCVYVRDKDNEYTVIATVVDDLIIASTTTNGAKRVSKMMNKTGLDTKDLGEPDYIIGMHVGQTSTGITLNQELYINTLIRRFNMENCHPCSTPADPNVKLSKQMCPENEKQRQLMKGRPYRALVGGLLYLILTRPDIAVAVNELCRHLHDPGPTMWTAAKRVLRYLKGTSHYKIRFDSRRLRPGNDLLAYVDASYADDKDTRRSRCGYLIYFDQSPITWKTILQKRLALSTAEAEYRAATLLTKEIVWLRRLLKELGFKQDCPTVFYEDNAACIKMIENPMVSHRNKHIEVDAHFVRDHFELQSILPKPIPSADQKADLFTKILGRPLFEKHTRDILDCTSEGDC